MDFVRKIEQYMVENGMLSRGDGIVLGVSGGADSICLLQVLSVLREKYALTLTAVHVNHGIRGAEADADERFAEEECKKRNVDCVVYREAVPELAAKAGCSEEEMGRRVRYRAFREVAQRTGAVRIAVAHNRNDNAETILFHAFRGAGVTGLQGILPCRDEIIRPLLGVQRSEIEQYLKENGIDWREDATNRTMDYARNRIRNDILKSAAEHINEGAVQHLAEAAEELAETEELLQELTEGAYRRVRLAGEDKVTLVCGALCELKPLLQKRVLLLALEETGGGRRDITRAHVEALRALARGTSGHRLDLARGITAERIYDHLVLQKKDGAVQKKPDRLEISIDHFPAEFVLPEGTLRLFLAANEKNGEIPKNSYAKWFDYDKISNALNLRNRQTGDYIIIHEDGRRKTLKQLFIDRKVPADRRDEVTLLAMGNRVLWAVGVRAEEGLHVDENTKRILVAELRKRGET